MHCKSASGKLRIFNVFANVFVFASPFLFALQCVRVSLLFPSDSCWNVRCNHYIETFFSLSLFLLKNGNYGKTVEFCVKIDHHRMKTKSLHSLYMLRSVHFIELDDSVDTHMHNCYGFVWCDVVCALFARCSVDCMYDLVRVYELRQTDWNSSSKEEQWKRDVRSYSFLLFGALPSVLVYLCISVRVHVEHCRCCSQRAAVMFIFFCAL